MSDNVEGERRDVMRNRTGSDRGRRSGWRRKRDPYGFPRLCGFFKSFWKTPVQACFACESKCERQA